MSIRPALIPAPECDPLDGACVSCASRISRYNTEAITNARHANAHELCEDNNRLNVNAGHPELQRDCDVLFPVVSITPPSCAVGMPVVDAPSSGGSYTRPTASYGAMLPAVQSTRAGLVSQPATEAPVEAGPVYPAAQDGEPAPVAAPQRPQPGIVPARLAPAIIDRLTNGVNGAISVPSGDGLLFGMDKTTLLLAAAGAAVLLFMGGKNAS